MRFYGEELFRLGIILIIITIIAASVFFVNYIMASRRLKKQLEDEYGPQRK